MADKSFLVEQVKDWQRQGEGYKQSWYNFVGLKGSANYDPNRHSISDLEEFLSQAQAGELDVSGSATVAVCKGCGRGEGTAMMGSSWGCASGGTGWGQEWSCGGGWNDSGGWGGKGGKMGMTPWDMMGMMAAMWEWSQHSQVAAGCGGKGWEKGSCGSCGGESYGHSASSYSGNSHNSDGGGSCGGTKPGDWICPSCKNVNFSHRDKCNKCGTPSKGQARLGMKPGDWICPNCGDLVFASKSQCKMCQTPKLDGEEGFQRGSSGGGSSSRYSPY